MTVWCTNRFHIGLTLADSYAIDFETAKYGIDTIRRTVMRLHSADLPKDKIVEFCQRWKITELALFGSVLRDDFRPDSDIDMLVTLAPDCGYSLLDLAQMQEELKAIMAHEVDLVEKDSLRNPFRRYAILNNMEVIYAA
jgi:predicted nucleotidyltransferase